MQKRHQTEPPTRRERLTGNRVGRDSGATYLAGLSDLLIRVPQPTMRRAGPSTYMAATRRKEVEIEQKAEESRGAIPENRVNALA